MLLGHLHSPHTYIDILSSKKEYQVIFDWLANTVANLEDGDHSLSIEGVHGVLFTKETSERRKAFFEAHRANIDLHYCIEGEEIIEWAPVEQLTPSELFNAEKDSGKFESPVEIGTRIHMKPGSFAIFLPGDGHMTHVAVDKPMKVRKVVVKIPKKILE